MENEGWELHVRGRGKATNILVYNSPAFSPLATTACNIFQSNGVSDQFPPLSGERNQGALRRIVFTKLNLARELRTSGRVVEYVTLVVGNR